jgi:hypothetical protein
MDDRARPVDEVDTGTAGSPVVSMLTGPPSYRVRAL